MASYCKEVRETLLHVVCMGVFTTDLCKVTSFSIVLLLSVLQSIHNLTTRLAYMAELMYLWFAIHW